MALRCQRMKHTRVVTSEKEFGVPVIKRLRTTDKSRLSQTKGTLYRECLCYVQGYIKARGN